MPQQSVWAHRGVGRALQAEEVRFVPDSPVEGDGFEPSVFVAREPVYIAEGELRGDGRAAKKIWRGTDGSNPAPSSGESCANLGVLPMRTIHRYLRRRLNRLAQASDPIDHNRRDGHRLKNFRRCLFLRRPVNASRSSPAQTRMMVGSARNAWRRPSVIEPA